MTATSAGSAAIPHAEVEVGICACPAMRPVLVVETADSANLVKRGAGIKH